VSDIIKFDTGSSPMTRYEYDDGDWVIDTLNANETLALAGDSIVLTRTFSDRIKITTYKLTDTTNSLYVENSEIFTDLNGNLLSSSTAVVSSGDDDSDDDTDEDDTDDDGAGDDNYDGSNDDDFQDGGLGDDNLDGGDGDDELWGGEGSDIVIGGLGADVLLGEAGDDDLDGGDDDDDLDGGDGDDDLSGGNGDDLIVGGLGIDVLLGEAGDDDLDGGADNDDLDGGDGADTLTGGNGNDMLSGGIGADYLYAGSGNDTVDGGEGDDTIVGGNGAGDDSYTGGEGSDTIKYASAKAAITVSLSLGTAKSNSKDAAGIGRDTLSGIENITAGSFNDTLIGNSDANVFLGEKGNDLLKGGDGTDTLDGGDGTDTADYSDKTSSIDVTLNGATQASVTVGGTIEDTIKNIENINGGSGDDIIIGDAYANTLSGGAGDDLLEGGSGKDLLDGGTGTDTADYSDQTLAVSVTLNGSISATVKVKSASEDTIKNIENVITGSGNDILSGDSLSNVLSTGQGNDTINGGLGTDILTGGAGNDRFVFNTKLGTTNIDTITDFGDGLDKIALGKSIFSALKKGITADNLVTGTSAELQAHTFDKNDFLIYNTETQVLHYDADGSGKAAALTVANVDVDLVGISNLSYTDFVIV
jgi:Ca2+-binding RTX toxin-like protein